MPWFVYLGIFVGSCGLLYWSGELIVGHLMKLSRYLGLTEFVVSFFVIAAAASLPNLLVGVNSAWRGIPELSLGDIFGNNIIAMTLAVAAAVMFAPRRELPAEDKTVQTTAVITILTALLPLFLMVDHVLSRADGFILISAFFFYVIWLFSKKERFSRTYDDDIRQKNPVVGGLTEAMKSLAFIVAGVVGLMVAAGGIVLTAEFFALSLGLPLVLVGILIVGSGNALPEVYFAIASARRGETAIIMGNLMGAVIFPATLVLGLVALIKPITISDLDMFTLSRFFLVAAAVVFLVAARSQKKIVVWEAVLLFVIYLMFLVGLFWVS